MSPLAIDYHGERFVPVSAADKTHIVAATGDSVYKTKTLDGSKRYMECAHGTRDSWVNISLMNKDGVNGEPNKLGLLPETGFDGFPGGSLDRVGCVLIL